MGMLKIERLGGLAGFGLPGSRLRSVGEVATSTLGGADQASVDALFAKPPTPVSAGPVRDGFHYRITRTTDGREQTIEAPESAVPAALKASVTDQLM